MFSLLLYNQVHIIIWTCDVQVSGMKQFFSTSTQHYVTWIRFSFKWCAVTTTGMWSSECPDTPEEEFLSGRDSASFTCSVYTPNASNWSACIFISIQCLSIQLISIWIKSTMKPPHANGLVWVENSTIFPVFSLWFFFKWNPWLASLKSREVKSRPWHCSQLQGRTWGLPSRDQWRCSNFQFPFSKEQ